MFVLCAVGSSDERHIMIAPFDLMPTLRQRLRIPRCEASVPASLPVLFFGDALSAHVATVGLNPSKFEYLDKSGKLLTGRDQRFAGTTSLGMASRSELTDAQSDQAIEAMRNYFNEGRPVYDKYFQHLTNFLSGMGVSFRERSATHLDLVQESTDPVWNGLTDSERSALITRDAPFLVWLLENLPHLKAVVCTGKTVFDRLRKEIRVDVTDKGTMERIDWWLRTAHVGQRLLPVGAWNYPLDKPTGLGTAGEVELGRIFAGPLLMADAVKMVSSEELLERVDERRSEVRAFIDWADRRETGGPSMYLANRLDIAEAKRAAELFPDNWWGVVVFTCFGTLKNLCAVRDKLPTPIEPESAEKVLDSIDFKSPKVGHHRTQATLRGQRRRSCTRVKKLLGETAICCIRCLNVREDSTLATESYAI